MKNLITVESGVMQEFISQYIATLLWSSVDYNEVPLDDNYSETDLSPLLYSVIVSDCVLFVNTNIQILEDVCSKHNVDFDQHAHDFALTRNGHGAGFWDRGYGDLGDKLTEASKEFIESCVYVGDDGFLYD